MSVTSEIYKTSYFLRKKNDEAPIVFIHGVGLTKEIWDKQTEFFKNYNILTYDLLGHGKTPLEKQYLNFKDYTKQLLNLIDETGEIHPKLMSELEIRNPQGKITRQRLANYIKSNQQGALSRRRINDNQLQTIHKGRK